MTMLDLRRTDLRKNVLTSSFVISSAPLTKDADDLEAVFFSFPATIYGGPVIINDLLLEIITGFDGTPVLTIGTGTIPLETSTTGATVSVVDADQLFTTAVAIPGTAGLKTQGSSAFLTDKAAGTISAGGAKITPADSTVPVVYATLTASTAITVGKAILHMSITILPTVA